MRLFALSVLALILSGCFVQHARLSRPAIVEQSGEQVVLQNTVLCQHEGAVVVEGGLKGNQTFKKGRSIQVFVYSKEGIELENSIGCVQISSHPESGPQRRWHPQPDPCTAWFRIPLRIVPPADGRVVVLPLEQECKGS